MTSQPNIICCLTPPGSAAIATLGLAGPDVWARVRGLFRLGTSRLYLPETPGAGRFWLGRLGEDQRSSDEVVLAVMAIEPVPQLEIHCHGGMQIIRLLLELFTHRGVRICTWDEWEHCMESDRTRRAALAALARAPTVRTAAILLDQYHGALKRALDQLQMLKGENRHEEVNLLLNELRHRIPLGRHLVDPWKVVVAGAPNVGKSSLINALAGYARSIVSPIPGTTRDVVTANIALDGWPVQLHDTAGLRDQGDDLEGQGILRARAAIAQADLCLWVIDGSTNPILPPSPAENCLLVINKIDLPVAWDYARFPQASQVSAKTGAGFAELGQRIASVLIPAPPAPGVAVPFTEEVISWIHRFALAGQDASAKR